MLTFKSLSYPRHNRKFSIIQEHSSRSYAFLFAVLGVILYIYLAKHKPLLIPGITGVFLVTLLSNLFGIMALKRNLIELKFQGDFFAIVTAYDAVFEKDVDYYPVEFSNLSAEGNSFLVNYKGQFFRFRPESWSAFNEIVHTFRQGGELPLPPEEPQFTNGYFSTIS